MGLQEDMPQTTRGDTLIKQLVTHINRRQASSKVPKTRFPNAKAKPAHKPSESNWNYAKKPSIAAASIIGAITFFAIIFLIVWYVRRRRQRKRLGLQLQDMENQLQDTFNQSSLTLNEDASKSLDDFLRKDIEPERTSLMFSRSRSPSLSFIVDENDRQRSPSSRLYRTSYEASSNTLGNLTRVSTEDSKPRTVLSYPDLTQVASPGHAVALASFQRINYRSDGAVFNVDYYQCINDDDLDRDGYHTPGLGLYFA
ncbi:hypothetical protein N7454_003465 [Penicillium verhagenii]|nr:hypothetical protein N7454_003465 [Penicillium verhagenii]